MYAIDYDRDSEVDYDIEEDKFEVMDVIEDLMTKYNEEMDLLFE